MVDHHDASAVMEQAWNDIGNAAIVSRPALRIAIEEVMGMGSGSKSLKYLLLTGIVARAVDPNIHPRAIQAASKLSGAYDAASLCKQVIVEFERTKGNSPKTMRIRRSSWIAAAEAWTAHAGS